MKADTDAKPRKLKFFTTPDGAKSSTTSSASLATKATASNAFPVLDQFAGKCRAPRSGP